MAAQPPAAYLLLGCCWLQLGCFWLQQLLPKAAQISQPNEVNMKNEYAYIRVYIYFTK